MTGGPAAFADDPPGDTARPLGFSARPDLQEAVALWRRWLATEKRVSDHTLTAYTTDVAAFLAWASEPKQMERKSFGLGAMIYLLIFTVLLYFSYRRVWRNVAH